MTGDELSGFEGGPGWTLVEPAEAVITDRPQPWEAVVLSLDPPMSFGGVSAAKQRDALPCWEIGTCDSPKAHHPEGHL